MLTSLALCLAPLLQDSAAYHPADTGIFIEIPDAIGFREAWQGSPLNQLVHDPALSEALTLIGIADIDALWEQIPPDFQRDVMPFLESFKGLSASARIELAALPALVEEAMLVKQIDDDLDALQWAVLFADTPDGSLPASLEELLVSEVDDPENFAEPSELGYLWDDTDELTAGDLIDPFGNPYSYSREADSFSLVCFGSDGQPGGTGLAADWSTDSQFESYLVAQLASIAGVELVVEWNDDEISGAAAGLLGMLSGRLPEFVQITDLAPTEDSLALAFSVDPSHIGVEALDTPIAFGFQQIGRRTILTIGDITTAEARELGLAAAGGSPHATSLSAREEYIEGMARVASGEGAPVWRGIVLGFGALPTEGMVGDVLGNVAAVCDFFGIHAGGSAWQTRLVDGTYVADAYQAPSTVGRSPGGSLEAVAAWVPDDAVFVEAGTMDPLGFWSFLTSIVEGEEELQGMLDATGVDIEGQLLANLGNEYAMWVSPVKGLALPQTYFIAPVKDGKAVMESLDGFADFLVQMNPDFRVTRRPYKGIDYSSMDVGIPIGFRPSFAVIEGNLWITNSSTLIKRQIRMRSKGEDYPRGAHALFVELTNPDGSFPAELRRASYFDIGSVMSAYYGAGRSFAGMIPADAGIPDGLVGALPEPEIFTRHFQPSFGSTRLVDGALVTHKRGPFGPEPLLLAVATTLGTFTVAQTSSTYGGPTAEPAPGLGYVEFEPAPLEPALGDDAELQTQMAYMSIDLGLLVYNITNQDYPATLAELLEATKAYPNVYLNADELPLDGWGHALVYERVSKTEYRLHSMGPDGIDQGGEGDDLSGF